MSSVLPIVRQLMRAWFNVDRRNGFGWMALGAIVGAIATCHYDPQRCLMYNEALEAIDPRVKAARYRRVAGRAAFGAVFGALAPITLSTMAVCKVVDVVMTGYERMFG